MARNCRQLGDEQTMINKISPKQIQSNTPIGIADIKIIEFLRGKWYNQGIIILRVANSVRQFFLLQKSHTAIIELARLIDTTAKTVEEFGDSSDQAGFFALQNRKNDHHSVGSTRPFLAKGYVIL